MTTLKEVRQRAEADAKTYRYYLNPDLDFLKDLLEGLKRNEERYGYPSCPCRVASGVFEYDRDILCPCDYRDPDARARNVQRNRNQSKEKGHELKEVKEWKRQLFCWKRV